MLINKKSSFREYIRFIREQQKEKIQLVSDNYKLSRLEKRASIFRKSRSSIVSSLNSQNSPRKDGFQRGKGQSHIEIRKKSFQTFLTKSALVSLKKSDIMTSNTFITPSLQRNRLHQQQQQPQMQKLPKIKKSDFSKNRDPKLRYSFDEAQNEKIKAMGPYFWDRHIKQAKREAQIKNFLRIAGFQNLRKRKSKTQEKSIIKPSELVPSLPTTQRNQKTTYRRLKSNFISFYSFLN